jgi:hypothetical protein
MTLNYTMEGEASIITIKTDRSPKRGDRVILPEYVVKRTWPAHVPAAFRSSFLVDTVTPLSEDEFNITLSR